MSTHRGRALMVAVSAVMLAAVMAGAWVIGSPGHQRALRLDAERSGDLMQISARLSSYWSTHKALPTSLEILNVPDRYAKDPATGQAYAYSVIAGSGYRLCAQFDAASEPGMERGGYMPAGSSRWDHPSAGLHCFDVDASTPAGY